MHLFKNSNFLNLTVWKSDYIGGTSAIFHTYINLQVFGLRVDWFKDPGGRFLYLYLGPYWFKVWPDKLKGTRDCDWLGRLN